MHTSFVKAGTIKNIFVFKGSTASSVGGDSLDGVDEGFLPVSIDVGAIRQVVAR